MRRALAILVVLAAAFALLVVGTGASNQSSGGDYNVRAIFDNAAYAIPGEDVKIAGVKVGKISAIDVTGVKDFRTPPKKAAITLSITEPGFQDFRKDANCTIRPQSLIGEKYVECSPTVPKAPGQPKSPPLDKIPDGAPGAGDYLLPVTNTSSPVDVDLIGDINRLPQRQRLTLIIGELGTGLAGNGPELNAVIRRANPAFYELDKVLDILGEENRTLARLAVESDQVITPLARRRENVAGFIQHASSVARATAERSGAIERSLELFPRFLAQVRPTAVQLSVLADQMTPVFRALQPNAPAINRLIAAIGPFSTASIPFFRSLGAAADVGTPAVINSRPLIRQLDTFATAARPLARNLSDLLVSFKQTGGVERLMDYLFYQVAAINGFDTFGHYLRAGLIINQCSTYSVTPVQGCSANFASGAAAASATTAVNAVAPDDPALQHVARIIAGEPLSSVIGSSSTPKRSDSSSTTQTGGARAAGHRSARRSASGSGGAAPLKLPTIPLPGKSPTKAPPNSTPAPPSTGATASQSALLEYLIGSGSPG